MARAELTIPLQGTLQQICPHLSWQITEIITACKIGHSQYSCMSKQLKNCKNIKQHGRGRNISDRHLSAGEEPAAKHSLLAAGVEFILWVSCALGTPTDATMLWLGNRRANYSAKYSSFVWRTRQPEVTRRQPSCPTNCWIPQPSLPRLPKNFSIVLLHCSGVVSLRSKMFYAAQTQGITHIKAFHALFGPTETTVFWYFHR